MGRDENPSVYVNEGVLLGLCRAFKLSFEVKLRRKIIFYKGTFIEDRKLWFEIIDETFSEDEMKQIIKTTVRETHEINKTLRGIW